METHVLGTISYTISFLFVLSDHPLQLPVRDEAVRNLMRQQDLLHQVWPLFSVRVGVVLGLKLNCDLRQSSEGTFIT